MNPTNKKKNWTQADIDKLNEEIQLEIQSNPITASLLSKGNTPEGLLHATLTGDLSQLVDFTGKPFSLKDQQEALARADEDTKAYYDQLQQKETADTEADLKQKQLDYQDYLVNQGDKFEEDKTKLDQNAADTGVLFSGARAQKEQKLQKKYEQEDAYKRATLAGDMGQFSRDFQYKYGEGPTSSLSETYKLGGNQYNPKTATAGVTPQTLSSVYDPSKYNFGGTQIAAKKTAAATRAAGILANRGNKLLSTGYNNQF